ncbi:hypothetical protein SDJN02_07210, partial [Cucurbita argyrosperma subsp. argyrosperma]
MFYFKLFVKSPLEAYPRQSQFNFQHLSVSIYIVGRRRLPPQARPWILPRVIAFLKPKPNSSHNLSSVSANQKATI